MKEPGQFEVALLRLKNLAQERVSNAGVGFRHNLQGSLDSQYGVVCISGGRGSGKTTLLNMFCAEMQESDGWLVVDPIEPEFFGSSDSVIGLTMARLNRALEAQAPEILEARADLPERLGGQQSVSQILFRLMRISSAVMDIDAPARSVQSLEQHFSDSARAIQAGDVFALLWRRVTDVIASLLKAPGRRGTAPRLLVAVDDPDLRPESLRHLLQHIRLLSTARSVLIVVCIDQSLARNALVSEYDRAFTGTTERDASAFADAYLLKTFPPYARVDLKELPRRQRLRFTPLGASQTLADLLDFRIADAPVEDFSVRDLFLLRDNFGNIAPSPYLDCLPHVPRELESLFLTLSQLAEEVKDPLIPTSEAALARALIEGCLRATRSGVPKGVSRDELVTFSSSDPGEIPEMRIDYSGIDVLTTQESQSWVASPERNVRLEVSSVKGIRMSPEKGDGESRSWMPNGLSNTMLVSREFASFFGLFDEQIDGGIPVFGGRRGNFLNISIDGESADSGFLVAPAWETYYEGYCLISSWKRFQAELAELLRPYGRDDPGGTGDIVVGFFIKAIILAHKRREVLVIPGEDLEKLVSDDRESKKAFQLGVLSEIAEALPTVTGLRDRDQDLAYWLEVHMPQALHPAIVSDGFADAVMASRESLLASSGRDVGAEENLRRALERRIRPCFGEPWVTGLLHFYKRYAADERLRRLVYLHEKAVSQRQANRAWVDEQQQDVPLGQAISHLSDIQPENAGSEPALDPPNTLSASLALRILRQMYQEAEDELAQSAGDW